jgi:hypothetical protein
MPRRRGWIDDNVSQRLARTYEAQSVTVFDSETRALAVAGRSLPGLVDEVAVAQSQSNVVVSRYVYLADELWLIATAPIVRHDYSDEVEGVLVLAQRVDDSFAGIVKRLTSNEITFIVKGEVATTTNRQLADALEQPAAAAALIERHEMVLTDEFASKGTYLGVDGSEGLMEVVSNQRAPISAAQTALGRAMRGHRPPSCSLAWSRRPERAARPAAALTARRGRRHRVRRPRAARRRPAATTRSPNSGAPSTRWPNASRSPRRRCAGRPCATACGLLNHREFYHRLTDEIARSERSVVPLSVLMIVSTSSGGQRHLGTSAATPCFARSPPCSEVRARGRHRRALRRRRVLVILPAPKLDAVDHRRAGPGLHDGRPPTPSTCQGETLTLSIGVATRWPGEHTATGPSSSPTRRCRARRRVATVSS